MPGTEHRFGAVNTVEASEQAAAELYAVEYL